ncbi:heme o synthase [Bacillus horti]|uniref:Protoheme IX farnesyltransferase n=1 Tax=Caldalkalibacillus horti TaxID=77523 RepID=A0ABT9W286_9BACI|nr:heme o synthase [Bacillus horti]MDQ0167365.1 protoheme IX farnesyltransferase [Bacillus horti]
MSKELTSGEAQGEYVSRHVMEPGPLADKKLTGTWKDYVTVTKLGIIFGNLITVIAGMWVATGGQLSVLSFNMVFLTLLGTTLIIASGTCLNNYLDRDIDQKMARTKKRALADGRLDPNQVLVMGFVAAILGTVLLLFVNVLTTLIALFGLFGYVVLYTMWLKRTHHLNTVVGSVAGAVPPMIGWSAVTGGLEAGAFILFGIMFVWQIPHFLAIAIRRKEDYAKAGIPMLPVVFGNKTTKWHMLNYVAVLIPVSLLLPLFVKHVGVGYTITAILLGILWIAISLKGFKAEDDVNWAKRHFIFSLNYMVLLFASMMIFSI